MRGPRRFEVWRVTLDPTLGSEIRKTRPCLVISPDEMNRHIRTVMVAPLTSAGRACPTRVACEFAGKRSRIVLDQLRTMDRARLVKRLGVVGEPLRNQVLGVLQEMFSP